MVSDDHTAGTAYGLLSCAVLGLALVGLVTIVVALLRHALT
jgi:hypothetical protein